MKNYAFLVLFTVLLSCRESDDSSLTEKKSESCATPARMKDLTGPDGCGYVFELNDGTQLNPICSTTKNTSDLAKVQGVEYADGKRVFINYKICGGVDICMVGPTVEITCIRESDPVPQCIKEKIEDIENKPAGQGPDKVYRYTYNGRKVYFFPQYCCDNFSLLYDENCNLICAPDGGYLGNGNGKCTDFFKDRTDEEVIWEDSRS